VRPPVRGPLRFLSTLSALASAASLASLTWLAVPVNPVHAYTFVAPYVNCFNETYPYLRSLEASLAPTEDATVPVGTPVTFSGNSVAELSFAVASSPTLLATPNIDSGLGSPVGELTSSPLPTYSYTFTSINASATPGTVYWAASFPSTSIPACKGEAPSADVTKPYTLTVVAAPPPIVPPSTPPAAAPKLRVSIGTPDGFNIAHAAVLYRVHCTASCAGHTSYQLLVARRHTRPIGAPKLGLRADPVSITSETGGSQQVSHRYTGHSLRALQRIIHAGDIVELRISVKVTDAAGNAVEAHRTAKLRT
jgi:hypothetical protein